MRGAILGEFALCANRGGLFICDPPPVPFDEYVIPPAALAIHADGDVVVRQESRELLARELAALIGVEDVCAP